MIQSEINKLHKSIATDFKIAARKTELWEIVYCHDILHDIKKLMTFGYLDEVSLIMNSHDNVPIKAKKYKIVHINRSQDDRPGGVDWEDGEGQSLVVLVSYTQDFQNLSPEQRSFFQAENLKIPWNASNLDHSFPHLTPSLSKVYTSSNSGIDRIDFN